MVPAGSKGLVLPLDASGLNSTIVFFAVNGSFASVILPATGTVRPTPELSPQPSVRQTRNKTGHPGEGSRNGKDETLDIRLSRESVVWRPCRSNPDPLTGYAKPGLAR